MRRGWSVCVSRLAFAAALVGGVAVAGAALAAGPSGRSGWHGGFAGHHGAASGQARHVSGRYAGRHEGRWGGWGYAGWPGAGWGWGGYSTSAYVDELAVSRYDPARDPAVCCGPRLPVALGIQAAPVLPPTTYVIGGAARIRHGAARRVSTASARGLGAGASEPLAAMRPRIIELH